MTATPQLKLRSLSLASPSPAGGVSSNYDDWLGSNSPKYSNLPSILMFLEGFRPAFNKTILN
ncbi:MAG: hypothetical protein JRN61_03545 [Nitrososphaerota archaeon]|nr:hypothetical protein [Nitrososphaerota archaeon]MDG7041061.1 hypothetical protein [Nitrososphaerota archaeon]MDG7048030.1 hypothetical protein [Nitrososphaerota archaeon]MDG7048033.1 hypothetical protein [Nitrososphaerota archaeon]